MYLLSNRVLLELSAYIGRVVKEKVKREVAVGAYWSLRDVNKGLSKSVLSVFLSSEIQVME